VLPDLFVPIEALAETESFALAAVEPVAPKLLPSHGRPFKVQPVLCPDNYIDRITTLVKSARQSLYLQYSYITYSNAPRDRKFQQLLDHIATLSHKKTFDLRIIVGNSGAREKVRKLVEAGFNENAIRVQSNVHNKGIIVDGDVVLVSSANWSSDGTLRNRDAGLIIADEEVARYYQSVFVDDWDQRARRNFGSERPARIALAGEPTPPGMVRMRWSDFHDE
jgi:phosphatidylserine/phosphatidylglycerophosphate/cardiolipin synthase-like enzyme